MPLIKDTAIAPEIVDADFDTRRKIAVHFNFKAGSLSLREITPQGRLGKRLGLVESVQMKDCTFTVDKDKWARWMLGNKHARQFAEIRGYLVDALPTEDMTAFKVSFWPKVRMDFFDETTKETVTRADYVQVSGRNISALKKSGGNKC